MKYKCMNSKNGDFIDSYCLSDNKMRTVISAILTVILFFIGLALGDTVDAIRTFALTRGINESAYIAMVSGTSYRVKSMLTKWGPLILAIMAFQYLPGSTQTLSNLSIKTVSVYVKNNSTASVFERESMYNVSSSSLNLNIPPTLGAGIRIMNIMRTYSSGLSSSINNQAVTTKVIKSASSPSSNMTDGDGTNSITYNDTVGTVVTKCSEIQVLQGTIDFSEYIFPNTAYISSPPDITLLYNVEHTVISSEVLYITSNFTELLQSFGITVACASTITFDVEEIVYTLNTGEIHQRAQISRSTTVDTSTFGFITETAAGAPEHLATFAYDNSSDVSRLNMEDISNGVLDFYATFNKGFFSTPTKNILHTKLVAAVADNLGMLFTKQFEDNQPETVAKAIIIVPVYNIVLQAYFPTYLAWIFAGTLGGISLFICMIGTTMSIISPINIKQANDMSLIDNIDNNTVMARSGYMMSNSPSKQRKAASKHVLYCREESVYDTIGNIVGKRIRIGYDQNGMVPNAKTDYM